MNKILVGVASVAAVLGTTAALAQMPAPTAPQMHGQMGARAHTRAEVAGHVQTMFARIDANRDGFVTKAEAGAMRGMAGQRKAERRGQRHGQGFERMDANRDGSISRAEWDARSAQRQQRMTQRHEGDGAGHGDAMRGKRGMGMGLGGRMFDMADANRDGRVTAQEATAAALQHFDMADTNRDGQLTRDERMQIQMHQKMRANRQRG